MGNASIGGIPRGRLPDMACGWEIEHPATVRSDPNLAQEPKRFRTEAVGFPDTV